MTPAVVCPVVDTAGGGDGNGTHSIAVGSANTVVLDSTVEFGYLDHSTAVGKWTDDEMHVRVAEIWANNTPFGTIVVSNNQESTNHDD